MAKVHLVLGAGGARGMAHIGIIEELEKAGHEIVEIIGCSMGAVVGGIYCAGHLPAYRDWLLTLSKGSVFKLMDFTLTTQGFLKGEKIFSTILDMCGQQEIENFDIPFTAVATDLHGLEEVHLSSGDLYQALRASISIPGIFTPVYHENKILVDGGVVNPVPVDLVKKKESGALVVAVDINAPDRTAPETDLSDETENNHGWPFNLPFFNKRSNTPSLSLIELLQTSYNATQNRLTEAMISLHRPDILIEIPRNSCGIFEFYKAAELIELGRQKWQTLANGV